MQYKTKTHKLHTDKHTCVPLSPSSITWYQRKLASKRTRRAIH